MSKKKIKHGICNNSECANYRLPVEITEDGNCPLCGEKLETDDDTSGGSDIGGGIDIVEDDGNQWKKILLIIAAVVAAVAIAVVVYVLCHKPNLFPPDIDPPKDSLVTGKDTSKDGGVIPILEQLIDTIDTLPRIVPHMPIDSGNETETNPTEPTARQTIKLTGCTWTGPTSGDKPNGNGRMSFTQKRIIDSYDSEKRTAEKGEYIIGEWKNGHLVQGTLYAKSGKVKEVIIIGVR